MTKIAINEEKKKSTNLLDVFKKGPTAPKFAPQGHKPVLKQSMRHVSSKTARGQSR